MIALNPLKGTPSNIVTYRAAGLPTAPGAITEIPLTRNSERIGLQWLDSSSNGGSAILVYTLVLVQDNLPD